MLFIIFQNVADANAEMDVTWKIAKEIAPPEVVEKYIYNEYGKGRLRSKTEE